MAFCNCYFYDKDNSFCDKHEEYIFNIDNSCKGEDQEGMEVCPDYCRDYLYTWGERDGNCDCIFLNGEEVGNTLCNRSFFFDGMQAEDLCNVFDGIGRYNMCGDDIERIAHCPHYRGIDYITFEMAENLKQKEGGTMAVSSLAKVLPKHVKGEFATIQRRKIFLEKKIEELKALGDIDIDVSPWYEPNSKDKYYDRWVDLRIKEGMFYRPAETPNKIYALAWQSCWPEESSGMIFQYFKEFLDVRFKWWGYGEITKDAIVLKEHFPRIVGGALPNINCTHYKCPGDYADPLRAESKTQRLIEFCNLVSSPNLRENSSVTGIYTKIAVNFQYCNLKVKREAKEETTTVVDLWFELVDKVPSEDLKFLQDKICNNCKYTMDHIGRKLFDYYGSNGAKRYLQLLQLMKGDEKKADDLIAKLNPDTVSDIVENVSIPPMCDTCCFSKWATFALGERNKIKRIKEELEKEFKSKGESPVTI